MAVAVRLREMSEDDAPAAADLWQRAFRAMTEGYRPDLPPPDPGTDRRVENRIRHFLATDPDGSWVADDGGTVVGLAQSFVRQGYWVLSLLATSPESQGRGVGRALFERSMGNWSSDGPGTIQSSRDPSAMALYASAGFSLHPVVVGDGPIRRAVERDRRVRRGGQADLEVVDAVDRAVRGSVRGVDIAAMLGEPGNRLLVMADRGYAVAQDERVVTLGARDDEAAGALLQTALAEMRQGADAQVGWITSKQQWAIRTLVGAGVTLHPSGAVMVRGMPDPPAPYLPSGGYG